MATLCTFPGRYGDLLWALPTIRAISRRVGAPVDLVIGAAYGGIVPLLQQQNYLRFVGTLPEWITQDTAPISPRTPPLAPRILLDAWGHYDRVLHLGYRDWPLPDVVRHTFGTARREIAPFARDVEGFVRDLDGAELDLQTPWITLPPTGATTRCDLAIAFTDEHFELKLGVAMLVVQQLDLGEGPVRLLYTDRSRWHRELPTMGSMRGGPYDWLGYAQVIAGARVVLTDCSAAHVLAVAMGKPAILMEPSEARHNAVFYPLGKAGPQVTLVTGNDGLPTFDARHVTDACRRTLERIAHAV